MMIESVNTRFFKLRRNALNYAKRQRDHGRLCQLLYANDGFIVHIFKESHLVY